MLKLVLNLKEIFFLILQIATGKPKNHDRACKVIYKLIMDMYIYLIAANRFNYLFIYSPKFILNHKKLFHNMFFMYIYFISFSK